MPLIEKTKTVHAGYACDMCGKIISDGEHDGMGGINWWGLSVDLIPKDKEIATIERAWKGYTIKIRDKEGLGSKCETWGLCIECADKVRQFIISSKQD